MEVKIAAILAHTSQVRAEGVAERVRARASAIGQQIGVEYAEAFHYLPMMQPPALKRLPIW
jgi:hypothetical protein